jgi:hypothetical protein
VDTGALAGAADTPAVEAQLQRILYDEGFREQLAARRRAVFGEPVKGQERRAAGRSAEAVLELVQQRQAG